MTIERRSEPRRQFFARVEFALKSDPENIIRGIATNISKSGLGILSYAAVPEGREITVRSSFPDVRSEYTVRCCEKRMGDFFAIGLRIIEKGEDH
jgi:hypothetical protein